MRRIGLWAAAFALAGCGADELRKIPCIDSENAFDIEEVSALEGFYSVPKGGDAVILDADRSKVPPDGVWRVGTVEVLVVIPERSFAAYPKNVQLAVQVWDDDKPTAKSPFTVLQTLDTSTLTWETVKLRPADEPTAALQNYKRAWWKFDFSKAIPDTGMTADHYLVAAKWLSSSDLPYVGSSNFNRPCNKNWSDYADGKGWILNGRTAGNDCNWPMFRVGSQIITQREKCE